MNKRQILRIDFFVQVALLGITAGAIGWEWFFGKGSSWALLSALLFVIWQFFSGIYIAAEFKMWYRGVPPGTLMMLITVAILLAAAGSDTVFGIILLILVPLVLLSNLILAAVDWYRFGHRQKLGKWSTDKETILDTQDVFKF